MRTFPRNWWVLTLLVLCLAGCGGDDDATDADSSNADISVFITNADGFREKGQFQAAFIEARNAIQGAPEDERGHVSLAQTLLELGQAREAARTLEAVSGSSALYAATLTEAYLLTGKTRSAGETLAAFSGDWAEQSDRVELLRGQVALAKGENDEAESIFQALIQRDAEVVDASLGLAGISVNLGDDERANSYVDAVLALEPENPRALLYKANIEANNGDLAAAEEYLMTAVSGLPSTDVITPLRFSLLSALRDVLTQQGKSSEALIYSGLLSEATPGAQEISEKLQGAMDAISTSDFDTAKALLAEVQELAPNSERAGTLMGLLQYLEGNNEAALEKFDQYVDPETASPLALQVVAAAELRLNQPENVVEKLKDDIDSSKDGRLVALYGIALISAGELEKGEAYILKAFELDPDNARLRLPLARLYYRQARTDEGFAQMEQAFKTDPSDPVVQGAYLQALFVGQRLSDGDKVASGIRSGYPDSAESLMVVASWLSAREQYDDAEKVLERVLSLGELRAADYELARLKFLKEDYAGAQQSFEALLEKNPEDSQGYKGLITAYELQDKGAAGIAAVEAIQARTSSDAGLLVLTEYYGRNRDFEKAFSLLAKADPDTAEYAELDRNLSLSKANALLQSQDTDGSRTLLLDALGRHPGDPRLLASLVTVEISTDQLDEARRVHAKLRDAVPDAPIVPILAGDIANRAKEYTLAHDEYVKAWQMNPTDQLGVKVYGMMRQLMEVGDPRCIAFLEEWREKLPQSLLGRVTLAGHMMETGDMGSARAEYEAMLTINADIIVAHNNLAWIYGEDEIDKAVEAGRKAYELAKDRAEIIDTYGWFLYKKGDQQQAQTLLAKALELAPDNAEIKAHYEEVSR